MLSKEPLFDQIVRPSELATEEDATVRNGDRYKIGANGQQSSQRPKIDLTAKLPLESAHFESLNLAVVLPGSPWVKLETPSRWVNGGVIMARSNPDIMVMLNGEAAGVELNLDAHLLVNFSKVRLLTISPRTVFANEKEETVGGIRGITFEASMPSPEGSQYCLIWVGTRHGYTYELALLGSPSNEQEIGNASRDFRRGLRQIDPKRVSHKPPSEMFTKYKSKAFGYDIDLTGLGWVKVNSTASPMPSAEVCASTVTGSGLLVLAAPMPNRVPDMELLAKSIIACTGLEHNGTEIVRTTPYRFGDLECREIETSRSIGGKKVLGRMRLICDDRCAYAAFGWSLSEFKEDAVRVKTSLDRFGVHPHQSIDTVQLSVYQREGCANLLNDIGLRYVVRGDLVAALDFFGSSMKLAPSNDACVANYLEVLGKLDRNDEALRFLNERKTTYGNNLRFRVLKARLLAQKGDAAGARGAFAELIADGYTDNAILSAYVDMAVATKAYDEALATVAEVMKKRPTVQVQRLQASLYVLKGESAKAIEMFEKLHSEFPDDLFVAVDMASAYEHADRYDAAIALTQKLVDSGKQDETLLIVHGRLLLHLCRTAEAKRTFERARELYPGSERVNEMLKLASSQLGEGENSCLKKSIDPVVVPAAVRKAIDQAERRAIAESSDGDAEEVLHVVGLSVEPGQPIRKTTTQRVKVYTASGVSRYGMIMYKVNPVSERLYVNQLIVTDDRGNRVAEGSVDNYFISDETSSEASNAKTAKIPVPGLKRGYTVECTVTRELLGSPKDLPFQEISLACESPARVSAFFVTGDIKQLKCKTSNGVRLEQAENVLYSIGTNVAPLRYEPQQPSVETFSPVVWVGPVNTTWSEEARGYLNLVEDKLVLDDATRALAKQLTHRKESKREKVAAIAEHVQQGYTYHAIEFGRRARIPNAASKTVSLKYGDCKDHALLTKQLLAAAGIEAHLALVRSSGDIVADVASLDQFDHMVVFVPAEEVGTKNSMGGWLVDATDKDADPLLDTPWGLDDRSVLVLDPQNPRLVHTPKYPADAGKLVSKRSLTFAISPSGAVETRVTEEVTLNEYLAPGMRALFKHFDSATRREAIQSLLSDNGPIRVKRVDPVNLDAICEPLRIKLEYTVPNGFRSINSSVSDKSLVGSLPCVWETQYTLAPEVDSRKTPFEVSMPRCVESSLTINVPDDYRFADLEQCNGSGQSEFRRWSSRASQAGQTVTIEYQIHLAAGVHPAAAYEQFYTDSNESLAVLRAPLTLQRQTGPLGTARRSVQESGVR